MSRVLSKCEELNIDYRDHYEQHLTKKYSFIITEHLKQFDKDVKKAKQLDEEKIILN